jgi:hypothetical protein
LPLIFFAAPFVQIETPSHCFGISVVCDLPVWYFVSEVGHATNTLVASACGLASQQSFLQWCNHHLEKRGLHVEDLTTGFCDGVLLCILLEIVSGSKIRHITNPRFPAQKLNNITEAFNFMERVWHIQVVGCNARGMAFVYFFLKFPLPLLLASAGCWIWLLFRRLERRSW